MARPEGRRDGTQIKLIIIKEISLASELPLFTTNGLYFKVGTKYRTFMGVIDELVAQEIIRKKEILRKDGRPVDGIARTEKLEAMLKGSGMAIIVNLA